MFNVNDNGNQNNTIVSSFFVPCVIDMAGSVVLEQWCKMNDGVVACSVTGAFRIFDSTASTAAAGIPFAVGLKYLTDVSTWGELFHDLATVVLAHASDHAIDASRLVLLIPTIGARHGISFAHCAHGLHYGMLEAFERSDSAIVAFQQVRVITPAASSSARVIQHIMNMMRIARVTTETRECIVCMARPISCLLSCGHYICCTPCAKKIHAQCPMCKVVLDYDMPYYECAGLKPGSSDYQCCDAVVTKSQWAYVPCGHANTVCSPCSDRMRTATNCPICRERAIAFKKIYVS